MRRLAVAVLAVVLLLAMRGAAQAQSVNPIVPPISSGSALRPMDAPPPGCFYGPDGLSCPTASPTPAPTPPPSAQDAIKGNVLASWVTSLLDDVTGAAAGMLDMSINFALFLTKWISIISLVLAAVTWWFEGDSLPSVMGLIYKRLVWYLVLVAIISSTWTFNGGPGWWPRLVITFYNIGALAGNAMSKATPGGVGYVSQLAVSGFHGRDPLSGLTMLPGEIIVLGSTMFTQILSAGAKGQGGIFGLLGAIVTGIETGGADMVLTGIAYVLSVLSAATAFLVCGYIAFRYAMTIVQTVYFGIMSFLQAFLASERAAGLGGGFVDGALQQGIELAFVAATAGLGEVLIATATGWEPSGWAKVGFLIPYVSFGERAWGIGVMLVLDAMLVGWAFMVRSAPEFAQKVLSGSFAANVGKLVGAFRSSGNPIARVGGETANNMEVGATHGAGALVAKTASSAVSGGMQFALGAAGGIGQSGKVAAMEGGLRGFLMGGPSGAVMGALGGFAGSRLGKSNEEGGDRLRGASRDEGELRGSTRKHGSAGKDDAEHDGGGGSQTRTKRVTTQVVRETVAAGGGGASGQSGSPGGGGPAADGGVGEGSAPQRKSGGTAAAFQPFGADATGWRGSVNQLASRALNDMRVNRSVGDLVAQRALYSSGRTPPPRPEYDEVGAQVHIGSQIGRR